MNEKVSIVVPVYNAANNIRKCILSILNQSYKNIEIIAIDDGSVDTSYSVLRELEREDNRLTVIKQENMGVSSARNSAIELCTGEFLQFVDADDYLDEQYIEQLTMAIKGYDLVISNYKIENQNKHENSQIHLKKYEIKDMLIEDLHKIYVANLLNSPCNKLFKLQLIRENSLNFNTSISMGEDLLFVLSYLEYCNKVNCVYTKETYNYVIDANEHSLTKNLKLEYLKMYEFINFELIRFIKKKGSLNKEQINAFNSGYTGSIMSFIVAYLIRGELNKSVYNKICREINLEYISTIRLSKKSKLILKGFMTQSMVVMYLLKIILKTYTKFKN